MHDKPNIESLIKEAEKRKSPIWEIVLENEAKTQQASKEEIWQKMQQYWQVMNQANLEGTKTGLKSLSGLVGEEGRLLDEYWRSGKGLSGEATLKAASQSMGVACVNASMGKIVATPTAGSCGILPSVLATVAEKVKANEKQIVGALFTAAGVGAIIDEIASTAGAIGGCQAECGAASCMAAMASTEMAGGSPRQAAHAGAMALKNIMGLVCDPVAGLVEVPCVKRNAMGAVNALLAADMALAGIESKIPIDEVIEAMREVGDAMPASLKETALGGLANTPTARELAKKIHYKS